MFHLRFTPDDISGYTFDFLENYYAYIVAFEDKDKYGQPTVPHYHILIDTTYGEKHVRDDAKAALKIPSSGRGKNNKYYMLNADWQDPAYICKYDDIRRVKGYSEKQLLDYAVQGKEKYLKKLEKDLNVVFEKKKTQSVERLVSKDILAWYHECDVKPTNRQQVDKACELYRKYQRGINKYKIRDIVHTLWYDVETTRDTIVEEILHSL